MASSSQPRNRLEDERGKNDEVLRRMWKTMETKTENDRMAEAEGGRGKGKSRKEMRRKGETKETKETKEGKDDGSKESSRRIGDMG